MTPKRLLFIFALVLVPVVAFAHAGHKHVTGTIVTFSATEIVVKTDSGNTTVPLSASTRYYHGSGTSQGATPAEVKSGMRVVVHPGADGRAVEVHIP